MFALEELATARKTRYSESKDAPNVCKDMIFSVTPGVLWPAARLYTQAAVSAADAYGDGL